MRVCLVDGFFFFSSVISALPAVAGFVSVTNGGPRCPGDIWQMNCTAERTDVLVGFEITVKGIGAESGDDRRWVVPSQQENHLTRSMNLPHNGGDLQLNATLYWLAPDSPAKAQFIVSGLRHEGDGLTVTCFPCEFLIGGDCDRFVRSNMVEYLQNSTTIAILPEGSFQSASLNCSQTDISSSESPTSEMGDATDSTESSGDEYPTISTEDDIPAASTEGDIPTASTGNDVPTATTEGDIPTASTESDFPTAPSEGGDTTAHSEAKECIYSDRLLPLWIASSVFAVGVVVFGVTSGIGVVVCCKNRRFACSGGGIASTGSLSTFRGSTTPDQSEVVSDVVDDPLYSRVNQYSRGDQKSGSASVPLANLQRTAVVTESGDEHIYTQVGKQTDGVEHYKVPLAPSSTPWEDEGGGYSVPLVPSIP